MKIAFSSFAGKNFTGGARAPKLLLFVITNFFYARKSRLFSSLPTHYRGAWGATREAPDRA